MPSLFLVAVALAGSLEMRAEVVDSRFLQVRLIARGSTPVLVTPRTTLGCYVEVEIQDRDGQAVGHFGPRATCPTPEQSEYQLFWNSPDFGAQFFGVDLDILIPDRVRLTALGGEVGKLEPDRDYRLIVTYHNDDAKFLASRTRRNLIRRYGQISAPRVYLRSNPLVFRSSHASR